MKGPKTSFILIDERTIQSILPVFQTRIGRGVIEWYSRRTTMTRNSRFLITLMAAVWMPICQCQLSLMLLARMTCCEDKCASVATNETEQRGCCEQDIQLTCNEASQSCDDDRPLSPSPCDDCGCCVTKGPLPTQIAIAWCTAPCILPPTIAAASTWIPAKEQPTLSLREGDPPGPPRSALDRCSRLSIWLV